MPFKIIPIQLNLPYVNATQRVVTSTSDMNAPELIFIFFLFIVLLFFYFIYLFIYCFVIMVYGVQTDVKKK